MKAEKEKMLNLTGVRFGRWVVLEYDESEKSRYPKWICRCDCGVIKSVVRYSLTNNQSQSCGCYSREIKTTQMGLGDSRLYYIRTGMIQRCYNKNSNKYNLYGGKGIFVCDEWLNKKDGFLNFYKWSMENGYKEELTIDRIDSNKEYSPTNCRWVDYYVQANNTNRNSHLVINGEAMTYGEICREYGFHENLIYSRLRRGITDVEQLIAKPKPKIHCNILVFLDNECIGKFKTKSEVGDFIGVSQAWVDKCLKMNKLCRGYSLKREVE